MAICGPAGTFIFMKGVVIMPNKIIFDIGGDTIDVDRPFLEKWYREKNCYGLPYDYMNQELSRTDITELAEIYMELELKEDGLQVTYELDRDPADVDIAEHLIRDIKRNMEQLKWMLPEENLQDFIKDLYKGRDDIDEKQC